MKVFIKKNEIEQLKRWVDFSAYVNKENQMYTNRIIVSNIPLYPTIEN